MSSFWRHSRHLYRTSREYVYRSKRLRWILSTLYWLPLGIMFDQHLYTIKYVSGRSMQPTLNPDSSRWKDLVIFDRLSAKTLHKYNRGDVIALYSPTNPGTLLVKRILALPGDTVKTLPPYPDPEVHIPPGHVWIEGDDPSHSEDSNWFGPIPQGLIDSKLSWIILPFDRRGSLGSVHNRRPQRGHAWSQEADQAEREKWRNSRVTPPP